MLHRQALELVEDCGHCLSSDTSQASSSSTTTFFFLLPLLGAHRRLTLNPATTAAWRGLARPPATDNPTTNPKPEIAKGGVPPPVPITLGHASAAQRWPPGPIKSRQTTPAPASQCRRKLSRNESGQSLTYGVHARGLGGFSILGKGGLARALAAFLSWVE